MPFDPYTALNAMLRAEVSRCAPPARQAEPVAPAKVPAASAESESEPQRGTPADSAA
ncbi:hypothetical protein ACFWUQ_19415 [Streptomyces sp. NPDC058662]|uniref:hypothetical protein n=1 Tax=Streptomyces sp. NPDC058662 TaxID=3346583 RepID=UPI0036597648